MSSRLTNEDDLVDYAANMSGRNWKSLTAKVSWLLRKRETTPEDVPPELRPVSDLVLDPETWERIRNRISKQRRAYHREVAKAKKESAILRRRAYMREYMARRRKK